MVSSAFYAKGRRVRLRAQQPRRLLNGDQMKIKVLGCYGADFYEKKNGTVKRYNPSGFLINSSVALEAGTLCGALTLTQLTQLRYIFLSHGHLDHIQSLAFLTETLLGKIQNPVVIISIKEVIDVLKNHLFNNRLWPDFTRLPSSENPIICYQEISEGIPIEVEGLKVTALRVNHVVPAIGFIIEDDHSAIVFSGDTWRTDKIWEAASRIRQLKAAFVESSFPDQLSQLARISGHLTPKLALQEFLKLTQPDIPLYLYHMKPPYLGEIQKQIKGLKNKRIRLLHDGEVLKF